MVGPGAMASRMLFYFFFNNKKIKNQIKIKINK